MSQAAAGTGGVWVGVMSGTSLDGLDVAVVRISGVDEVPSEIETLCFRTRPYDVGTRARFEAAIARSTARDLALLHRDLGAWTAAAVREALESCGVSPGEVRAIGSHGHTVWHEPPTAEHPRGITLQLGDAAGIAEATGIPVVSDFRSRDMAAGGHGAPLTAYTDWLLFRSADTSRAIQNLGGMANVTALPGAESEAEPLAFDTGPGVALLDAAVRIRTAGRQTYDLDGKLAARGTVDGAALQEWLADPYFEEPPPKSTGRERFGEERVAAWLERRPDLSPADALATLVELTASSIGSAYRWIPFPLDEVFLAGGGARHPLLRQRIAAHLDPLPVGTVEDLGIDGDAREAVAFALLARQHVLGIDANAPWATGAAGRRPLGVLVPA